MNISLFGPADKEEESFSSIQKDDEFKQFEQNDLADDNLKRKGAFRKRFGIDRLIYKNKNMMEAIRDPSIELAKINEDYQALAWKMSELWRRVYITLLEAGYSEEEAKRRSDEYIAPLIMAETKLIKARHPFALGGGKKEKQSMMEQLFARLKGTKGLGPTPSSTALLPEGKGKEKVKGESEEGS